LDRGKKEREYHVTAITKKNVQIIPENFAFSTNLMQQCEVIFIFFFNNISVIKFIYFVIAINLVKEEL
jgi:hypothetical protein